MSTIRRPPIAFTCRSIPCHRSGEPAYRPHVMAIGLPKTGGRASSRAAFFSYVILYGAVDGSCFGSRLCCRGRYGEQSFHLFGEMIGLPEQPKFARGMPSASARFVHTTRHDVPWRTRAEGQRGADLVFDRTGVHQDVCPSSFAYFGWQFSPSAYSLQPKSLPPSRATQRPNPRRTHAGQHHLEPANCSF